MNSIKIEYKEKAENLSVSSLISDYSFDRIRNFINLDLSCINFDGDDLRGVNFSGCDMRFCDFRGSLIDDRTSFEGAILDGSMFTENQLRIVKNVKSKVKNYYREAIKNGIFWKDKARYFDDLLNQMENKREVEKTVFELMLSDRSDAFCISIFESEVAQIKLGRNFDQVTINAFIARMSSHHGYHSDKRDVINYLCNSNVSTEKKEYIIHHLLKNHLSYEIRLTALKSISQIVSEKEYKKIVLDQFKKDGNQFVKEFCAEYIKNNGDFSSEYIKSAELFLDKALSDSEKNRNWHKGFVR